MGQLPEGIHELSCDGFPCAWACVAAGGVLGRAEGEVHLQAACRSPETGQLPLRQVRACQIPADGCQRQAAESVLRSIPAEADVPPASPLAFGERLWMPGGSLVLLTEGPAALLLWLLAAPASLVGGPTLRRVWPPDAPVSLADAPVSWLAARLSPRLVVLA